MTAYNKGNLDYFLDSLSGVSPITARKLREFVVATYGSTNAHVISTSTTLDRNHHFVKLSFENNSSTITLPAVSADPIVTDYEYNNKVFIIFNNTDHNYNLTSTSTIVSGKDNVNTLLIEAQSVIEVIGIEGKWLITSNRCILDPFASVDNLENRLVTLETTSATHTTQITNLDTRIDNIESNEQTKYFKQYDFTSSTTWVVTHDLLNPFPQVTMLDDMGDEIDADIRYISATRIEINFSDAMSGKVLLSI